MIELSKKNYLQKIFIFLQVILIFRLESSGLEAHKGSHVESNHLISNGETKIPRKGYVQLKQMDQLVISEMDIFLLLKMVVQTDFKYS